MALTFIRCNCMYSRLIITQNCYAIIINKIDEIIENQEYNNIIIEVGGDRIQQQFRKSKLDIQMKCSYI